MRKRESISILFLWCHYTSLVLVRPETRDHTQPGIKSAESPPLLSSPHRAKTCEAQRLSSSHWKSERWELGDCDSDFLSITNTKQEQPLTKSITAMTDEIGEPVSVVVSSIIRQCSIWCDYNYLGLLVWPPRVSTCNEGWESFSGWCGRHHHHLCLSYNDLPPPLQFWAKLGQWVDVC